MRPLVAVLGLAGGVAAGLAARRWLDAAEVRGGSMAPALIAGDRLLVEAWTLGRRPPRTGDVVLAPDPREPGRELVKRVAAVDLGAGTVKLYGDAGDASTDSRSFGSVPVRSVRWRVLGRYWPPARIGVPSGPS
jgi:nickel-type superoxide dismutase maturation protease